MQPQGMHNVTASVGVWACGPTTSSHPMPEFKLSRHARAHGAGVRAYAHPADYREWLGAVRSASQSGMGSVCWPRCRQGRDLPPPGHRAAGVLRACHSETRGKAQARMNGWTQGTPILGSGGISSSASNLANLEVGLYPEPACGYHR